MKGPTEIKTAIPAGWLRMRVGESAAYFLRMIMLLNKIGTLSQTRMGLGRVPFSSKMPMKG